MYRCIRKCRPIQLLLGSVFILMFCAASLEAAAEYKVLSPDGKVDVRLACANARLSYSLSWNGRKLFNKRAAKRGLNKPKRVASNASPQPANAKKDDHVRRGPIQSSAIPSA